MMLRWWRIRKLRKLRAIARYERATTKAIAEAFVAKMVAHATPTLTIMPDAFMSANSLCFVPFEMYRQIKEVERKYHLKYELSTYSAREAS